MGKVMKLVGVKCDRDRCTRVLDCNARNILARLKSEGWSIWKKDGHKRNGAGRYYYCPDHGPSTKFTNPVRVGP